MIEKRNGEPADSGCAYAWFWIWMTLVTVGAIWVYLQVAGLLWSAILALENLADFEAKFAAEGWWDMVLVLLGLLFWWRVVKVAVLQGSPLPFGMKLIPGGQNDGRAGRSVVCAYIGNKNVHNGTYGGKFWHGALFRANPASDKLVRCRVELLVLALPFGFTLSVHESRLFVNRKGHEGRAKQFSTFADNYLPKSEDTPK